MFCFGVGFVFKDNKSIQAPTLSSHHTHEHFPVQREMSPVYHTLWTTPGASLTLLRGLAKASKPGGPRTVRQDQAGSELELWEGHGESWSPQPPRWLCPWGEVTEDREWWPQRGPGQ